MDQHITYHVITDDVLRLYPYYIGDDQGATVAADHCDAIGMDAEHKQRFLDLLPHFAAPADYPFDQTHAFSIALTQGFFGPYFYIHDAQLTRLGDVLMPYEQSWTDALPDFAGTESAGNRLRSQFSAGVFVAPAQVAQLMSDAHSAPDIAQALGHEFPGEKLNVLWSALQTAHDMNAGLLEAAGVIEPNPTDLAASTCYSRFAHCDQTSLQHALAAAVTTPAEAAPPAMPDLPVPAHMQDKVFANPGDRLPSTPSLTERLREKRGDA